MTERVDLWISSRQRRITCRVTVAAGIIVSAAPVLGRFVGQPYDHLLRWLQPDRVVRLDEVR